MAGWEEADEGMETGEYCLPQKQGNGLSEQGEPHQLCRITYDIIPHSVTG